MTDYDNTNRGALFANDRKSSDSHPTHTGSLNAVCPCCQTATDYWLSAWVKDKKSGGRFFSLSVKPKESNPSPSNGGKPPSNQSPKPFDDGMNDEIPF